MNRIVSACLLGALVLPASAVAGPFSGFFAEGEMGISNTDTTGLDDSEFTPQITDDGIVGPGIECELIPPYVSGDFSDVDRTLTVQINTSWGALPFNGLRFSLNEPGAPDLFGAYLISTTIPAFGADRIAADTDTVALNFQGISAAGTVVVGFPDPPVGPEIDFIGSCSGTATASLSGFSPNANVALLRGAPLGTTTVPAGPCAGTDIDLGGAGLVTFVPVDANGDYSITRTFGGGPCGATVQAIDMTTCETSNVMTIP